MSNPLPNSITADKLAQKLYAFRFDSEMRNVWRFRNYDDTDARSGEDGPPVARIRGPMDICVNRTYTWDASESYASAEGASISSYSWEWGDSTADSSGETATHKYTAAGTYTVTLTVTDSNGLEGKESKTFDVQVCVGCANRAVAAIGTDGNGYVTLTGGPPWNPSALGSAGQAVAYDPADQNRVYFGTNDGNIHRTSNASRSIDTVVAVSGSAITSLVVDPVNRNIIWAGDAAGLLFRSPDWGLTFALVLDTGWLDRISSITVDPHNTQRVLFCGTNSGGKAAVGETTNWGATFEEINAAGGGWADDHTEATEVVFASGNTDTIYVSLRGGPAASSVRRGNKASGIWVWANASGLTEDNMGGVAGKVADQNASWAVEDNENATIWRSAAWAAYATLGTPPSNPTRIDADMGCPDNVWLALVDGVALSTDGGGTIVRKLTSGRIDDLSLGPLAEAVAESRWMKEVYVATKDLGVFHTLDFVNDETILDIHDPTWTPVNTGINIADAILGFRGDPFRPGYRQYLLNEAGFYRREDGGSWTLKLSLAQAMVLCGIERSEQLGENSLECNINQDGWVAFCLAGGPDPLDWLGSFILISTDYGESFTAYEIGKGATGPYPTNGLTVGALQGDSAYAAGDVMYVMAKLGSSTYIYTALTRGVAWTRESGRSSGFTPHILVDPTNQKRVFVGSDGGVGPWNIMESVDHGDTQSDYDGAANYGAPTDEYYHVSIAADTPKTVRIGAAVTDNLKRTRTNGTSWEVFASQYSSSSFGVSIVQEFPDNLYLIRRASGAAGDDRHTIWASADESVTMVPKSGANCATVDTGGGDSIPYNHNGIRGILQIWVDIYF